MRNVLLVFMILTLAGLSFAEDSGHLILGGEDADDPILLMPRQVEEGPDGNLYVLDTGDSTIKVFSPEGAHLRTLGRKGEGPGEFQRADGATFGFTPEGGLFFTEFYGGHRWITLLNLDGTLAGTVTPRFDALFGIEKAVALTGGRFLVQMALDSEVRGEGDVYYYATPRVLKVMDAEGNLEPAIAGIQHVRLISTSPNGGTTNLPFTPVFCWVVDADYRVIWTEGMRTGFDVFDLQGNRLPELPTPLPEPARVTSEELSRWQEDRKAFMLERNPAWWERFGRAAMSYDKALTPKPNLRNLSLTPRGNFLIQGRSGPEDDTLPYWLLNRQGALLHAARLPVYGLRVAPKHLLFFTTGEDGLPLIHAMKKEPTEAGSLKMLEAMLAVTATD
jgi:hypothetical protein